MGVIWECDGLTGMKGTIYKDLNCLIDGSWQDYYMGSTGPGFKPSDSLIKAGAVITISKPSIAGPFVIGSVPTGTNSNIDLGIQLSELHGCKSSH